MNVGLLVAGVALTTFVLMDLSITASTASGSGPFSRVLRRSVWGMLSALSRLIPPARSVAGALTLALSLLSWLLGLLVGWTLVFSADPGAVVRADSLAVADVWERVYFTGSTVFILGVGDYIPQGAGWQLASTAATLTGVLTVILAIAYLVPVSLANMRLRSYAVVLHDLGSTSQEMLMRGWDGSSFEQLSVRLRSLLLLVSEAEQEYRANPVLHNFHTASRRAAFAPSLAAMDEAVLLLESGVDEAVRPHPMVLGPLRAALDRFAAIAINELDPAALTVPATTDLNALRRVGIPTVTDAEFQRAVEARDQHRGRLAYLVQRTGWHWSDAVETSR